MIFDRANMFAMNEEITDTDSEDLQIGVVNVGVAGWGYKQRAQPWIIAQVEERFTALTNLTLTVSYSQDDSSYTTILTTGAIARANLTRGRVLINQAFPALPDAHEARYLRGTWTVGGSDATAGRISFGIIPDGLRGVQVMKSVLARRVPTTFDYFPGDAGRAA